MKIKNLVQGVMVGGTVVVSMGAAQAADIALDTASYICGTQTLATISTSVGFISTGFVPRCSTNTDVSVLATVGSVAVLAASRKGKTYYGGTTTAGTPSACSYTVAATYTASAAAANGCT